MSLNDEQRQEIEAELFASRRIEAIKIYRRITGAELVEAKKAIEDWEVDLRRRLPERFISGSARSGCLGMALLGIVLIGGALFAVLKF